MSVGEAGGGRNIGGGRGGKTGRRGRGKGGEGRQEGRRNIGTEEVEEEGR